MEHQFHDALPEPDSIHGTQVFTGIVRNRRHLFGHVRDLQNIIQVCDRLVQPDCQPCDRGNHALLKVGRLSVGEAGCQAGVRPFGIDPGTLQDSHPELEQPRAEGLPCGVLGQLFQLSDMVAGDALGAVVIVGDAVGPVVQHVAGVHEPPEVAGQDVFPAGLRGVSVKIQIGIVPLVFEADVHS